MKDQGRFEAIFRDTEIMRGYEFGQAATDNRDVGYFRDMLARARKRSLELARYIVDTARLIVEADERAGTVVE